MEEKNKKVIFHFLNTGNYSGAENVVVNIAQLVDRYEHVYVSPNGDINEVLRRNNISHVAIPKLSFFSFWHIISKYKPDIVHAHDFKASIIAGILSKKVTNYGGKLISQLHKNDVRMRKISIISVLFFLILKRFSKIIVVSQSVIDEYVFKYKLEKKAVVINNIVNLEKIERESLTFNAGSYDIIYLARISNEKDPLRFLNIIERVNERRPVKVVWVGDGSMLNVVKRTISLKNLDKVVQLLGFQSNPYPYIVASKISILTSKYEGFGLSALEAQLLGKPVVSTDVGGIRAIVTEDTGLLTNKDDEFVNEIIKLLDNQHYYLEKQINAKNRSKKINDISEYVKKINRIYAES
ncbi:glycosyltransferase [Leuconostoc suionicum]|uniref:glycosyltransferase n=1 Tax=Leuconostoc suionicum TaxID=1511761 RepID=UPI0024AD8A0D|nr:glycosyltransferase [Leuconostoc suionicum]MDI6498962.1 glycosyltransferase [Leuconostoc suionicum]MDI6501057.1 glycosyltransferase [Leuconostoc suionicum]MDI6503139.1 glycosyltransferase [Leuconostoc suionicum]MDI6615008.1 glycosyltransferase [Leuconostoc suionicum]MDI6666015.1 glycosyltransferase [Leuconostoc suionicum]